MRSTLFLGHVAYIYHLFKLLVRIVNHYFIIHGHCIYRSGTADNIGESIQKDDLEKERSLNRELQARLMEKENQLKISEKQNEKLKRHMMTTNTLVKIQQEQIKRLKLELSKMTNSVQARNGCDSQPQLSSTGYNSVSTTDTSPHGLSLTNRMVTNSPPDNA